MRTLENPAVVADLVTRLRRLSPARARAWGSMNAHQMAVHVGDAFAAVLKQRPFSARSRRPNPLRKFVALNLLPRLPRGVRTGADPAAQAVEPTAFTGDVERAVTLLHQLAIAAPEALVDRHPIFGRMSRRNWMRWGYMHADHHLRQFGL